MTGLM